MISLTIKDGVQHQAFIKKLEEACRKELTSGEILEQKVSFIYGSIDKELAGKNFTKDSIRHVVANL